MRNEDQVSSFLMTHKHIKRPLSATNFTGRSNYNEE